MTDRRNLRPVFLSMRALRALATAFAMLGALVSPLAHAERADRDKPLNIESDHMSYDDLKQVNIFTGNVTMTKGTIILKADRVEVTQDPEGYQYATAYYKPGGPLAYMRQKRDGLDEYIDGWGQTIYYNGKTEVATLTTQATLKRLAGGTKVLDEIHGSVITYDTYNEVYTANSGADQVNANNPNGRVRATLAPRNATGANQAQPGGASKPGAAAPKGDLPPLSPSKSIGNPRE
ncbi:lipopolysaccharide transport periplasmic protein LptA [Pandoraea apista]|uniref:Lipopolysaccharide export system protein LptA n=1 Tax=Pandoraea apista TaxID=93218 RepID=A0A5E5P232_9BURK|nr:lipopolysaccharide transport periplasmic protein LptA [Pandoraea apista]OXS95662.1 lipopolysaccharide transport periplasmic protein LptA [Pandoraea apista]PTE01567.1 lipopolysaccharide transport periplasmic protein LptA [Pandoraea apista]RRJ32269.1 lipopolysaccharide transport periplasmic protein LptA [Pandoraea apista]RRJ74671.1 lipopolysaccharide transport periplasmic protein LptA [Pandoraea apista]